MPGAVMRRRLGGKARGPRAAHFAGANTQFMGIADNPALSMGAGARLTIVAWIYPESFATVTFPVSKAISASAASNEYVVQVSSAGLWQLRSSNGTTTVNSNGVTLLLNTWNFAVAQYDGTNIVTSLNAGAFTAGVAAADIQDSTNDFRLGAGVTGTSPFTGSLDSVGIAKSALSAGEITELYNGAAGKAFAQISPALAAKFSAYWDLDDAGGSGATWTDKAGSNHLTGGTGTAAPTSTAGKC